jgi:adenylate cyclase
MKKEIERRFLVDTTKLPELTRGLLITQGYLSSLRNVTDPLVRVRTENKRAFLTIKIFETELTQAEFEYPIPLKEAQSLLNSALSSVQKIRYTLRVEGKTWIVDVYEGENYPLVVAEIELKSEIENFTKPLWLSKEVSSDNRFHAYSLSIKPFSTWKKSR